MTLFEIAKRNIWRNLKEYLLYFVALTSSMVIYFIFASLRYNNQIKKEMITNVTINNVLQSSKVILIIFIAIFIVYSTNFFIRKRKKELGLYSLLGIPKKQIGTMLFCETMIMGGAALVIGILIGSMSFKLFLELLMSMMKLNTPIRFEMSIKAIIDTFTVFSVILLYTAWNNSRLIYQFQLIELFQANHKGESMPKGSKILAYIALMLIGLGYFLAAFFHEAINYVKDAMPPIVIPFFILFTTVIGTYFLYTFYTVILIKKIKKKIKILYNGMNMLNISQLLYQVKGNAKLLATIAILSATALTAISTVVTGYYYGQSETKNNAPYSFSYKKQDDEMEKRIQAVFEDNKKKNAIIRDFDVEMLTIKGESQAREGNTSVPNSQYKLTNEFQLMSQSNFNLNAQNMGVKKVDLNTGEVFIYSPENDKHLNNGNIVQLPIETEQRTSVIKGIRNYRLTNLGELVVIVPDYLYKIVMQTQQTHIVKNVDVTQQEDSKELTESLVKLMPNGENSTISTFYKIYIDFMNIYGLTFFIGSFLGLIFVLATGSIIYYKQLSEAYANQGYYETIRKIGVTKKELRRSISKKVSFSFISPVIVGLVHSLFAIPVIINMPIYNIFTPILISSGAYCIIYLGYYVLTVYSYFKIVYKY
ncbi:ABC transporter permease [Bacillus cereus group sp. BfR-BA-01331]|uniref:ABC transporter permease n=1 Tax=Bacillus cereus group sp. BfR-BA-01331 TaxID=2920307 RepID=UPI001F5636D2|nr:ABC transporter permease [Bacillus cereus group sp. BfR-BA-01331]